MRAQLQPPPQQTNEAAAWQELGRLLHHLMPASYLLPHMAHTQLRA